MAEWRFPHITCRVIEADRLPNSVRNATIPLGLGFKVTTQRPTIRVNFIISMGSKKESTKKKKKKKGKDKETSIANKGRKNGNNNHTNKPGKSDKAKSNKEKKNNPKKKKTIKSNKNKNRIEKSAKSKSVKNKKNKKVNKSNIEKSNRRQKGDKNNTEEKKKKKRGQSVSLPGLEEESSTGRNSDSTGKSVKTRKNRFAINRMVLMMYDIRPEELTRETINDLRKIYALIVYVFARYSNTPNTQGEDSSGSSSFGDPWADPDGKDLLICLSNLLFPFLLQIIIIHIQNRIKNSTKANRVNHNFEMIKMTSITTDMMVAAIWTPMVSSNALSYTHTPTLSTILNLSLFRKRV